MQLQWIILIQFFGMFIAFQASNPKISDVPDKRLQSH